jgi:hypothetical protein
VCVCVRVRVCVCACVRVRVFVRAWVCGCVGGLGARMDVRLTAFEHRIYSHSVLNFIHYKYLFGEFEHFVPKTVTSVQLATISITTFSKSAVTILITFQ